MSPCYQSSMLRCKDWMTPGRVLVTCCGWANADMVRGRRLEYHTRMTHPLLLSHMLSYSGAPIALLSMAQSMQRLGYQPVVASLFDGPMRNEFLAAGIDVWQRIDPRQVAFVVANTVQSVPTALRLKRYDIPLAAWIHESAAVVDMLGMKLQDIQLDQLDMVWVPARFQFPEFAEHVRPYALHQLRNLVRQDFFRLTSGSRVFAVTGVWEARKGQDDLVRLASLSGVSCSFRFIGAYIPGTEKTGIYSGHEFLGHLAPQVAKRCIAESVALISCSRSEVQNLTVIESVQAGRPALLSDIPAHREMADYLPNIVLFDRTNPESFRQGWLKLQDMLMDVAGATSTSQRAKTLFGERAFDLRLAGLLDKLRYGAEGNIEAFQD